MAKTEFFLSVVGTDAMIAVLLERWVTGTDVADERTNRSSFFSPAANAGEHAAAAVVKTRSVCNVRFMLRSISDSCCPSSYFLSRRTREMEFVARLLPLICPIGGTGPQDYRAPTVFAFRYG